jgi:2-keto-3-deoxy-L-rhamnonate aldolase RhmA
MSFAWFDKQRLGQPVRGTFLNLGNPLSVRMAAQMGFDWVLIDLEHGAGSEATLPNLLMAVEGTDCAPIVRVVSNSQDSIKRALDLGAVGVMVPYVSTAEQAAAAVSYTHYPPDGTRGVAGLTVATDYGLNTQQYHREANEKVLTVVQIETALAIENAQAIAAVPGVDVLFVGPLDLSYNLGCPKNYDHDDHRAARDHVVAVCRQHNKAAGILSTIDTAGDYYEQGFTFVAVGSDGWALRDGLQRLRDV